MNLFSTKFYFIFSQSNCNIFVTHIKQYVLLQKELKQQGDFLFLHRGTLPLLILVTGLAVFILTRLFSEPAAFLQTTTFKLISLALALSGEGIRIFTVGYTPANTSGRNRFYQLADEVNTTGIYSTVRHPLYLGNFIIWLGIAMLTENIWFVLIFILTYWIYYERIMYAEEMFLYNKFNESYQKWAAKTPAFIPDVSKYESPKLPFSWKKVLKKEKNGISAIFALFFIFDFTGNIIEAGRFVIELNFWFYAALATFILYLILKYLKWNTSVLDEEGR